MKRPPLQGLTRPCSSIRARRGLLFAELTIGLAITGVLMLALASFTVAVSKGWQHSRDEFKARSADTRGVAQLQDAMTNMLCVVQTKVGGTDGSSAYFFCWKADAYGGVKDGKAQVGEMALVEFDPTTKAVWIWQCADASTMTLTQKVVASGESWGDYTSPTIVSYFKLLSFVSKTPLVGGYASTTAGGVSVASAQFATFAATGGKPVVSYRLVLTDATTSSISLGNVVLRMAQSPTNLP